jgi:dTDP-4-dehydrorhamnose reductase
MTGTRTRVLVIGSQGQISRSLIEVLQHRGFAVSVAARPDIDLADVKTLAPAIQAARPRVVINPAAYTAVDRAEDEPDLAIAVNCVGAAAVASEARKIGAAIIHFSTDYVFDGTKTSPYQETDATSPLGVYGLSKLAGELAVAAVNPRHVILRTAWVCSADGSNFLKTMLRLAANGQQLSVVDDQRGAPTFAADIAEVVAPIVARVAESEAGEHFGIFHLASAGETSWYGFARAIMAGSAARGGPSTAITPIPTRDYPTRARRPAYSKLSTEKIKRVYGLTIPDWDDGLMRCLDALLKR